MGIVREGCPRQTHDPKGEISFALFLSPSAPTCAFFILRQHREVRSMNLAARGEIIRSRPVQQILAPPQKPPLSIGPLRIEYPVPGKISTVQRAQCRHSNYGFKIAPSTHRRTSEEPSSCFYSSPAPAPVKAVELKDVFTMRAHTVTTSRDAQREVATHRWGSGKVGCVRLPTTLGRLLRSVISETGKRTHTRSSQMSSESIRAYSLIERWAAGCRSIASARGLGIMLKIDRGRIEVYGERVVGSGETLQVNIERAIRWTKKHGLERDTHTELLEVEQDVSWDLDGLMMNGGWSEID
ncbi:hypothetical protein Tco_0790582 [Tanacetum coccineum]